MNIRSAPPRASAMMEALRGIGYSPATALADIVDNSISASATEVRIEFNWEGDKSRISIVDNGEGMTDSELEQAMRLGDKSPLDQRESSDLGRFGMGLKTASFSQCRMLTVMSCKDGNHSCLRWDLDRLSTTAGEWSLFEGPNAGSDIFLPDIPVKGTCVLWENLDRIVTRGFVADDFLELIDGIERHFAMVFHRLLEGPRPRLRLFINDTVVQPWDPFMLGHPGKPWHSPPARQRSEEGFIEAECHVLPHKDKLSVAEFETAGGPGGWTASRGFTSIGTDACLLRGAGWDWVRERVGSARRPLDWLEFGLISPTARTPRGK